MSSNTRTRTDRRKKPAAASGAVAFTTASQQEVSRADIARKAYELYCARGGQNGSELDDWLRAERELLGGRAERELLGAGAERQKRSARPAAALD